MAPKVPHVALAFWAVKLLTTGMGEAISDFVSELPVVLAGLALLAALAAFLLAFRAQWRAGDYRPVRYWSTVAMIAVFGTMAADVVHAMLGNVVATVLYALAVAAALLLWRRTEGSVSVHSITTRRRELFYWATVAATFALGTAAGDLAADTLGLGYRDAALVFAGLMLVVAAAWRLRLLAPVPAFWTAYVLTRPLGASLADWFGKPASEGHGLGLGDGPVSAAALLVFAGLLVWLARTGHDAPREEPAPQA